MATTTVTAAQPPSIDLLFFPHIFDQIFQDASHDVLVTLRQTCQDLKSRVDAHLGEHVVLWERTPLPEGLRALDGGQLPLLRHRHRPGGDLSSLTRTRVLDIPGAVNAVAFDKVVRALGTELEVIRTYDRQAMLLPSLRYAHAGTYVRFLSLLPTDRHPCIPLGCRKVVINVDACRVGTGENVLVDFAYMSRGVKEMVVVFTRGSPLRTSSSDVDAANNSLILALAKTADCHPWLLHQLLSFARYVPQHVGRLTFVNLFPVAQAACLEDVRTLLGRILASRLQFSDYLLREPELELYHGSNLSLAMCEEVQRRLASIEFISTEEYAAHVGPKTFRIETDSSAFVAYERQFEAARGVEVARL